MKRLIKRLLQCVLIVSLAAGACLAAASDFAQERRWRELLVTNLGAGEAVILKAGAVEFLGLYIPAGGKLTRGGVVLLHDVGGHPDWPDVIAPLRENLTEAGWATLSIQLPLRPASSPVADYARLLPDASPRIAAAIAHLQQQKLGPIVLIGHGLGATMATHFLASAGSGASPVRGLIGIGMSDVTSAGTGDGRNAAEDLPTLLGKLRVAVLDVYGAQDTAAVLKSADARQAALVRGANPGSRQQVVSGADHFFRGMESVLTRTVTGWLSRQSTAQATGQTPAPSPKPKP